MPVEEPTGQCSSSPGTLPLCAPVPPHCFSFGSFFTSLVTSHGSSLQLKLPHVVISQQWRLFPVNSTGLSLQPSCPLQRKNLEGRERAYDCYLPFLLSIYHVPDTTQIFYCPISLKAVGPPYPWVCISGFNQLWMENISEGDGGNQLAQWLERQPEY